MKVVINTCYGGFNLSEKAANFIGLEVLKDPVWGTLVIGAGSLDRSDPKLIECVETFGEEANGEYAKLEVVEIPDDVEYEITNYDGSETIEEVHRHWS